MFSELFAPVSIGVRTIAKTVRILERNHFKELTFKGERPLVFILSGAGLSAESGIPTFRDANGLWRKYDPKELASIGALERHTQDVFDFYNERIKNAEPCRPNAAHIAIAEFQKDVAAFCDVIPVSYTHLTLPTTERV